MEHTPLPAPWKSEKGNIKWLTHGDWHTFCRMDTAKLTPEGCKENAAYIVLACNHFEEMRDRLRIFDEVCTSQIDPEHCAHNHVDWQELRATTRAILQKIEKGQ